MPYTALLKYSFSLVLRPGLWLLAVLMALDVVWQFALNTAFVYSGFVAVARDIAGDQMPARLTGTAVLGLCFGAGVIGLLISTFGEAVLLISIGEHSRLSQRLRSGGQRYGALLIVRVILSLPILALSGLAAAGLVATFKTLLQRGPNMEAFGLTAFAVSTLLSLLGAALVIIVQCVAVGAERAAVLERLSARGAIQLGWQLLRRKFGDFVVIGVLLLLVSLIVSAGVSCVIGALLSVSVPFFSAAMRDSLWLTVSPAVWLSAIVLFWVAMAFGYLFTTGVWTLAYRHWRDEQSQSEVRE